MEIFHFKTSVKCGGCVATVTPFLNNLTGLKKWSFDLAGPDRILTAETEGIFPGKIIETLEKAGFKAEQIV